MTLQVATNSLGVPQVHTVDEQGLVCRSIEGLIYHAANRAGVRGPSGSRVFLNARKSEAPEQKGRTQ